MKPILIDFQSRCKQEMKPVNGICNGPVGSPITGGDYSKEYREAGFSFVRLHDTGYLDKPYWVDISHIFPNFDADENDPANYLFHHTDRLLQAIEGCGAKTIYRLGESIDHNDVKRFARPPKDFEKWARICANIVRHYNCGWANGYQLGVKYWEIWNEPECLKPDGTNPMWVDGTLEEAFELYRVTASLLRKEFPDICIGGMAFTVPNDEARQFVSFCREEALPLDFLSFHRYFTDIEPFIKDVEQFREYVDKQGYEKVPFILDEWNYFGDDIYEGDLITGITEDPEVRYRIFEKEKNCIGASFAAAFMIAMNDAPIDIATYYDGQCLMPWCGIFDCYGRKTKTFYAFCAYAELYRDRIRVKTENENEGLYVLAGENAVLISNYTAESGFYDITMNGLGDGSKRVELYLLDEQRNLEHYKTEIYHGQEVVQSIYLEKNSLALLKLEKEQ